MRRGWILTVLGSLLAAPLAVAQQAPLPPPIQTAPPPPVQIPPPPPPAAEWQITVPMSQRLVLNRGPANSGGYLIERNGVMLTDSTSAEGLDVALAGSAQAVDLARQAQLKFASTRPLAWTSLILSSLSGAAIGVSAVAVGENGGQVDTASAIGLSVGIGALIAGIVVGVIGNKAQLAGQRLECDAVNAYNSDLVDGKLRTLPVAPAPAVAPAPPPGK